MIKEEKIRMMTQVAMIQKREERRAIEICGYRKKDYVSIQMSKIWICYTMAYLVLTLIGVICMGCWISWLFNRGTCNGSSVL